MTQETIGRYEIRSEIGRGGMAAVYLAHDPRFRRNVAIKVVSVSLQENMMFRQRFEREAQLIAKIEHPAIVPVYDFGEQDNQPYLVMRYMPGGALTSKIKEGSLSLPHAIQILSQLAPALDAVHAQGIVHRDLKPANILLDGFGNPAISDFGIAHFTQATSDLTGSAVIGTPAYMSPEQVRSDIELDGRSDIYALGVILFEMLSGAGPFRAATPLSVAMKHLTDPIPSILTLRPDLPAAVDLVLQKALAKDREMRYTSASELILDLEDLSETFKHERSLSHAIKTTRPEDMATEIDTGEKAESPSVPLSQETPGAGTSIPSPSIRGSPQRSWMPRIAGLAGIGICLLIACGSLGAWGVWSKLGLPSLVSAPTQAVEPTHTAIIPTESQKIVLYSDDFSDPLSGWPTIRTTSGAYSYQPDGYHIAVNETGAVIWAKTSTTFDDLSVSVETRLTSPDKNGYSGLLCRVQDDQNFYYFVIRNNAEYTIGKYKNAEFQSLLPEGWKRNNAILPGAQMNRVQADCTDNRLRLYANDVLLEEVTDSDFTSGFSGVMTASLDSPDFEVVFNNFLITEPDL